MDEATFTRAVRSSVTYARQHAADWGARNVEAEHLLMALAARPDQPAGQLLASLGLDSATIESAWRRQRAEALGVIGMSPPQPRWTDHSGTGRTPGWGASAKEALLAGSRNAKADGRSRKSRDLDLLIGIVAAHYGTVPRILAAAGVDPGEIRRRAIGALAS